MAEWHTTSCPLNCWDTCGFKVKIEEGQVTRVDGDPDHPITQGKICGRGRKLADRTNDPARLLYPLKKTAAGFEQISWEQAIEEIAGHMNRIKESYGPTAVMHSHDYSSNGLLKNLDRRFFNAFGGATELVGSLCWGAGIEAQIADFGNALSHAPDDILNSRQIVVWGRNAARTNIHLFNHLQQAKKRGIPITVIDPIYNACAKISDRHIAVKPGSDGNLALGILKVLIESGRVDRGFVNDYCSGFSELEAYLNGFSWAEIESAASVPRETLEELADVYAAGPTSTFIGLGMQRYTNGGNTIRAIDALVAASGNVGIPGGGANYANLAVGQAFDTDQLAKVDGKTEKRFFTRMKQAESLQTADDPPIKMLIVSRSNPLTQVPNTDVVRKAFSEVPVKVVIDQQMTDTAEIADYILPSTTVFEEEDIYFSSMYHHYVNYGPKLAEPPGEARSDLEIWTAIAEAAGFGDSFRYTKDDFFEMGLTRLAKSGITLDKIREKKRLPLPVDAVPWQDYSFKTASRKFRFVSERAARTGTSAHAEITYPAESAERSPDLFARYPYRLLSIHPMRSNHSQHYPYHPKDHAPFVEISREIAEAQDIKKGDRVEVFNERGKMSGFAVILNNAHPDIINIDEGRWQRFGGSPNQLTSSREADLGGLGSTLYDCLAAIRKTAGSPD